MIVFDGSLLISALEFLGLLTASVSRATENNQLLGQDRLNNQRLLRPKRLQRWHRMHPLLGGIAHGDYEN
jgi:hypothetical protein